MGQEVSTLADAVAESSDEPNKNVAPTVETAATDGAPPKTGATTTISAALVAETPKANAVTPKFCSLGTPSKKNKGKAKFNVALMHETLGNTSRTARKKQQQQHKQNTSRLTQAKSCDTPTSTLAGAADLDKYCVQDDESKKTNVSSAKDWSNERDVEILYEESEQTYKLKYGGSNGSTVAQQQEKEGWDAAHSPSLVSEYTDRTGRTDVAISHAPGDATASSRDRRLYDRRLHDEQQTIQRIALYREMIKAEEQEEDEPNNTVNSSTSESVEDVTPSTMRTKAEDKSGDDEMSLDMIERTRTRTDMDRDAFELTFSMGSGGSMHIHGLTTLEESVNNESTANASKCDDPVSPSHEVDTNRMPKDRSDNDVEREPDWDTGSKVPEEKTNKNKEADWDSCTEAQYTKSTAPIKSLFASKSDVGQTPVESNETKTAQSIKTKNSLGSGPFNLEGINKVIKGLKSHSINHEEQSPAPSDKPQERSSTSKSDSHSRVQLDDEKAAQKENDTTTDAVESKSTPRNKEKELANLASFTEVKTVDTEEASLKRVESSSQNLLMKSKSFENQGDKSMMSKQTSKSLPDRAFTFHNVDGIEKIESAGNMSRSGATSTSLVEPKRKTIAVQDGDEEFSGTSSPDDDDDDVSNPREPSGSFDRSSRKKAELAARKSPSLSREDRSYTTKDYYDEAIISDSTIETRDTRDMNWPETGTSNKSYAESAEIFKEHFGPKFKKYIHNYSHANDEASVSNSTIASRDLQPLEKKASADMRDVASVSAFSAFSRPVRQNIDATDASKQSMNDNQSDASTTAAGTVSKPLKQIVSFKSSNFTVKWMTEDDSTTGSQTYQKYSGGKKWENEEDEENSSGDESYQNKKKDKSDAETDEESSNSTSSDEESVVSGAGFSRGTRTSLRIRIDEPVRPPVTRAEQPSSIFHLLDNPVSSSIDMDGDVDVHFVEQYENLFQEFLYRKPRFMQREPELLGFLKVVKLQKILETSEGMAKNLKKAAEVLQHQKAFMSKAYHTQLMEASHNKTRHEFQLKQVLENAVKKRKEMEAKLTWERIVATDDRAKRQQRILADLAQRKASGDGLMSFLPDVPETRFLQACTSALSSEQLPRELQKDEIHFQVDNALLQAEIVLLEREIQTLFGDAKKHAWVDSIFMQMDEEHMKKLKQLYQAKMGVTL